MRKKVIVANMDTGAAAVVAADSMQHSALVQSWNAKGLGHEVITVEPHAAILETKERQLAMRQLSDYRHFFREICGRGLSLDAMEKKARAFLEEESAYAR